MTKQSKIACSAALAVLLSAATTAPGLTQEAYPVDTVTMVVPYAAGGAGDIVGRIVADELSRRLGVNFVVENVGGASGTIGAEQVSRAAADGSTLLLGGNAIFTTAPHMAEVGFDPFDDFTPIANVSEAVRMLVSSKTLPVATLEEFIAYGKEHPGELNYGSVGVGSTGHVATVDMLDAMGIEATHIPYTGAAQVVQAVLAGDVQFMMDAAAIPQVRQDALTPLAVPGPDRLAEFPDVPALAEQGIDSISGTGWQMVMGPAGMPAEVVAMIEDALKAANDTPEFADKLVKAGVSPRFMPGSELGAALQAEYNRFDEVLTEIGLAK
ncbi:MULTISPECIES: tripartite tricarboxylate transporter substrate binding protein [unclassified Devosia]|uniref:Bug family tripartite tricarboxylate transporter substrate binding protein n=1 Tax=unclassified Devosia TaxID=196773 RepID=UPI00155401FC|nr:MULTISPECIES: tripartite tricarboxylate transporter substrate binding protein [unclassified Devosia]